MPRVTAQLLGRLAGVELRFVVSEAFSSLVPLDVLLSSSAGGRLAHH